jgi:zinc transporter ZupT
MIGAGLATGLGGLALLVIRRPSDRLLDGRLGFTAGVMLGFGLMMSSTTSSDRE